MRMIISILVLGLWPVFSASASDKWTFEEKIAITEKPVKGVFQHLEGGNRKHIAITSSYVAAAWEDDRTGDPQIYLAVKKQSENKFSTAQMVSSASEAYEPSIASVSDNRFIITWEQEGAVFARVWSNNILHDAIKLSQSSAGHATIITMGEQIYAAWREQLTREWFIKVASLTVSKNSQLKVNHIQSVETKGLQTPVLFPVLTLNAAGLGVAWEDRRAGHTRLMFSHSKDGAKHFNQPQSLNEFYSNRNEYDKGNGVTRVSMSSFAEDETIAAWMDKRRGENGYGIYGAMSSDGGASFGPNERIHSERGDKLPHYNPATAGNVAGDFVVVWDDFRNENSDIWLSSYTDDLEWSEDFSPAIASGAGEQTHPAVALDVQGNLHLIWMERAEANSPGQLWYGFGTRKTE